VGLNAGKQSTKPPRDGIAQSSITGDFKMKRFLGAALVAAFLAVVGAPILEPVVFHIAAYAADAAAPETVAQSVSEGTKVTWAWGATVSQAGQALAWILASVAMVMLRKLPANIVAIFGNARVELLINNAIGYGLNAVSGAVKGKTLQIDVGNEVLAKALQYAVDNAPAWLQSWAGGPEGLAKKIWGRLNLGEGASDAALPAAVAAVKE
jgi:hypothetical protein